MEYKYTGDKKPTVQDGIVIEDEEGNQFVWIPVGKIKNKEGDPTTIDLARYTFKIEYDRENYVITGGDGSVKDKKTDGSILHDEYSGDEWGYLEEASTSTTDADENTNTRAKNIGEFISKTKANGGYYLARYEASYKDDTHCYSKVSTGTPRTSSSVALTNGMLWNYINQKDAATVARNSFSNGNVESDLVNSYAWDTAIVFIQTYSGDNDYSKEVGPTFSSTLKDTGTTADKRCNIYDMASNTAEWTTETSTITVYPYTVRGGYFGNSGDFTAHRLIHATSYSNGGLSFRPLLYVKQN